MAKRFTDSEKWKDEWFQNLGGELQLFYLYVLDNCDCAGIWKVNFRLFEFNTGIKLNIDCLNRFEDRLVKITNEVIFARKFIRFQYGTNELNETSSVHKGILKSLKFNGIESNTYITVSKGLDKGYVTIKDKDKNKNKVKVKCINTNYSDSLSHKKQKKPKCLDISFDETTSTLIGITDEFFNKAQSAYQNIDIAQEIKKAEMWLLDNPKRRSEIKRFGSFLMNWFGRAKPAQGRMLSFEETEAQRSRELGAFFEELLGGDE